MTKLVGDSALTNWRVEELRLLVCLRIDTLYAAHG